MKTNKGKRSILLLSFIIISTFFVHNASAYHAIEDHSADNFILTYGNETKGNYTNTWYDDGVRHEIQELDNGSAYLLDFYYEFYHAALPSGVRLVEVNVTFDGEWFDTNENVSIYLYNFSSGSWILLPDEIYYSTTDYTIVTGIADSFGLCNGTTARVRFRDNDQVEYVNSKKIKIDYLKVTMVFQDTEKPSYSNLSAPSGQYIYDTSRTYNFGSTWTDNYEVDTVLLELNGFNYTVSNISSFYYKSFVGLEPANYRARWWANDTENNWNVTSFSYFDVLSQPASGGGGGGGTPPAVKLKYGPTRFDIKSIAGDVETVYLTIKNQELQTITMDIKFTGNNPELGKIEKISWSIPPEETLLVPIEVSVPPRIGQKADFIIQLVGSKEGMLVAIKEVRVFIESIKGKQLGVKCERNEECLSGKCDKICKPTLEQPTTLGQVSWEESGNFLLFISIMTLFGLLIYIFWKKK